MHMTADERQLGLERRAVIGLLGKDVLADPQLGPEVVTKIFPARAFTDPVRRAQAGAILAALKGDGSNSVKAVINHLPPGVDPYELERMAVLIEYDIERGEIDLRRVSLDLRKAALRREMDRLMRSMLSEDTGGDPALVVEQLRTELNAIEEEFVYAWRSSQNVFIPTPDNRPAETPALITFNGHRVLSAGNIFVLLAAAGFGKSSVCEAIAAAAVAPDVDAFGFEVSPCKVLFVDTERTPADFWDGWHRAHRRAGAKLGELPDAHFRLFSLIDNLEERKGALLDEIEATDPAIVILDGLGDFCTSPNDEQEAIPLLWWFSALAKRKGFGLFCTIHPNPGNGNSKARGHVGSEAQRRAEAVLQLKRNDDGSRTITSQFEHGKVRNASDRLTASFMWSHDEEMFVSCMPTMPEVSDGQHADLQRLAVKAWGASIRLQYADVLNAISAAKGGVEARGGSIANARRIHERMVKTNVIAKDEAGAWYIKEKQEDELPF